jgi:hypothetical protein
MSDISPKAGSLGAMNGYRQFAWQGGYYDHIIRNEKDLTLRRRYIRNNPLEWALDPYHIEDS